MWYNESNTFTSTVFPCIFETRPAVKVFSLGIAVVGLDLPEVW